MNDGTLKSWRITLQEVGEEQDGRGSSSRYVIIGGMITLCVSLVALIASAVILQQDHTDIILALIAAISGGGTINYTLKQVFGKAIRPGAILPPPEEPKP